MAMESPFKSDILKGKVALLTGGASGIGFEISTQLGKHGASVAIMGRRKAVIDAAVSALQSLGIPAIGIDGDVRKQDDAKRVIETTFRHYGRIDILVNAAAGNFLVSPEDLSPNGFRTVLDIDSVGTFTMCHEALKYLKKGGMGKPSTDGGGLILNISATLHYSASWYQIHVSAAKAAVDATTRNLALEWGTDYDIRVNGIAPGPISGTPGMSKLAPEDMTNKSREYMPLSKIGEKWDIAMAAVYLASNAGNFINGMTVAVDGGLWLSKPRHIPKEAVKQLSRVVEKRSRQAAVGLPKTKWWNGLFPCSHACAAAAFIHMDSTSLMGSWYSWQKQLNVYGRLFAPFGDQHSWPPSDFPIILPDPSRVRGKGRPRSTRIRNEMDLKEPKKKTRCTRCAQEGHNKRRCPSSSST